MNASTDSTLPPPAPSGQQAPIRLPLGALAPDPKNPRRITDEAAAGLATSTETFGDLSGIVFNDRTKQLIAGHQRIKVLRAAGATDFQREGNTGYIVHPKTGERFPVRFVDRDETWQRLANLTANNSFLQGTFEETTWNARARPALPGMWSNRSTWTNWRSGFTPCSSTAAQRAPLAWRVMRRHNGAFPAKLFGNQTRCHRTPDRTISPPNSA